MIIAALWFVSLVATFVFASRYGARLGAEAYAEMFAVALKSEEYGHKVAAYINAFDHKLFNAVKKHL